MTATTLGPIGCDFFERRQISSETAAKYGIYTASFVRETREVLPDNVGNLIVFPTIDHGIVVNEKYRTTDKGSKKIWQKPNGRRTFWNCEALDDPALHDGRMACIITEGEPDALTAIDCGFPLSVSVPDGASDDPRIKGENPEELKPLDPQSEHTGKFEFMWNNRDRLKPIKRFILATDDDPPGIRLRAEIVRRLSAARCMFVTYPQDLVIDVDDPKDLALWPTGKRPCKDLNEVRMTFGADAVVRVLTNAQPFPVRGLYRLSQYPDLPPLETFRTGFGIHMDVHLRMFIGEYMVVTGIPTHGKSTWVLNLVRNLNELHGWRTALFSPEMRTVPQLRDKLRTIRMGRPYSELLDREFIAETDAWINENILFIDNDPTGNSEDTLTLDWIIERATDAVMRDGIRVLVIDPWNEVEHAREKSESMHDYIGRSSRALKRWGQQHAVCVIVIAHPTKDVAEKGKPRAPTPYDIDGSSHWFNKPDHIVVVWNDYENGVTSVDVRKARFDGTGEKGRVMFKFDKASNRYRYADGKAIENA